MNTSPASPSTAKHGSLFAAFVFSVVTSFAAPPLITGPLSTLGVADHPFAHQVTASGSPASFAATGLPEGLSIDPGTGLISGTTTEAGVFEVEVSAVNIEGADTAPLTLTVAVVGQFTSVAGPRDLAFDLDGNLLVSGFGKIVKLAPDGSDRMAIFESEAHWRGLACDAAGNLLAADTLFGRLAKFPPAGVKTSTLLDTPNTDGVAIDAAGNIYFARTLDHSIGKITPDGVVGTFASGPHFSAPAGMVFDAAGNLYVANFGKGTVLKITTDGTTTPFATGLAGPTDVAFGPDGTLYATGYLHGLLYKIAPDGTVSTLLSGLEPFGPTSLAVDADGTLFVGLESGDRILRIGAPLADAPVITNATVVRGVKNSAFGFQITAIGSPAQFDAVGLPAGLDVDAATGAITGTPVEAGTFSVTLLAANHAGTATATLTLHIGVRQTFVTDSRLATASSLAFDAAGNLLACTTAGELLQIAPDGTIDTLASGFTNATDLGHDSHGTLYVSLLNGTLYKITRDPLTIQVFATGLREPRGFAFDAHDNLFVAEYIAPSAGGDVRGLVSKISPSGMVDVYATGAELSDPLTDLAFDPDGNLLVACQAQLGDSALVRISPDGARSFFASPFGFPARLGFDPDGTLYVADRVSDLGRIQCVTTSGRVGGFASNDPAAFPGRLGAFAFDGSGDLFVVNGNQIVRVTYSAPSPVITSAAKARGVRGEPFHYQITATHNPTAFAADGLPKGLRLDAVTGEITGVPTKTGTFCVDLAASNDLGAGFGVLTLKIVKPSPPDVTPPTIKKLKANTSVLWPADRKLVKIKLSATVDDDVGVESFKIIKVTSDEPESGIGPADMPNDIRIVDDLTVKLRAERDGRGTGRTYTIKVAARDAAGNKTTKTLTVFVPKHAPGGAK